MWIKQLPSLIRMTNPRMRRVALVEARITTKFPKPMCGLLRARAQRGHQVLPCHRTSWEEWLLCATLSWPRLQSRFELRTGVVEGSRWCLKPDMRAKRAFAIAWDWWVRLNAEHKLVFGT